ELLGDLLAALDELLAALVRIGEQRLERRERRDGLEAVEESIVGHSLYPLLGRGVLARGFTGLAAGRLAARHDLLDLLDSRLADGLRTLTLGDRSAFLHDLRDRVGDRLGNLGRSFGGSFCCSVSLNLGFICHRQCSFEFVAVHNTHCAAPFQEEFLCSAVLVAIWPPLDGHGPPEAKAAMGHQSDQPTRHRRGLLIVLSSPSGAGKTTISRMLLEADPDITMSVSATTRPQRPGEAEGVDYHFVDDAEFDRLIAAGEFVEWAPVFGFRYGTPKAPVKQALRDGR